MDTPYLDKTIDMLRGAHDRDGAVVCPPGVSVSDMPPAYLLEYDTDLEFHYVHSELIGAAMMDVLASAPGRQMTRWAVLVRAPLLLRHRLGLSAAYFNAVDPGDELDPSEEKAVMLELLGEDG